MNKSLALGLLSALIAAPAFSAPANSGNGTVVNFVPRANGAHSLFITPNSVPTNQGCTYNDRGIIVATDAGANAMLATVLLAISNGYQINMRVDGCALANPSEDAVATAPKITKIGVVF